MRHIFSILILFLAHLIFSQEKRSYIIKLSGDTIYCSKINFKKLSGYSRLMVEINDKKEKIDAKDLSKIYISVYKNWRTVYDNTFWEVAFCHNKLRFLQRMNEGEIVLLKMHMGNAAAYSSSSMPSGHFTENYLKKSGYPKDSVYYVCQSGNDAIHGGEYSNKFWPKVLSKMPLDSKEVMDQLLKTEEVKKRGERDYLDVIKKYNAESVKK